MEEDEWHVTEHLPPALLLTNGPLQFDRRRIPNCSTTSPAAREPTRSLSSLTTRRAAPRACRGPWVRDIVLAIDGSDATTEMRHLQVLVDALIRSPTYLAVLCRSPFCWVCPARPNGLQRSSLRPVELCTSAFCQASRTAALLMQSRRRLPTGGGLWRLLSGETPSDLTCRWRARTLSASDCKHATGRMLEAKEDDWRLMLNRILFALVLLVAGCAASIDQLAKRASFDLDCPREDLHYRELDAQTMGVRGCGRQATYVEVCRSGENCTWVMNNALN